MQTRKQAATIAAATMSPAENATPMPTSPAPINTDSQAMTRNQMRPVKYDYADSFACTYIVSVVAAANAELVTYPLDLTKTRLQIQGEAASAALRAAAASGTVSKPQVCLHIKKISKSLSLQDYK